MQAKPFVDNYNLTENEPLNITPKGLKKQHFCPPDLKGAEGLAGVGRRLKKQWWAHLPAKLRG